MLNSYYFNNSTGIGDDITDQTQREMQNTRFTNYMVSNYFSENVSSEQIQFATSQPTMMLTADNGIASSVINDYSQLLLGSEERPLEKLSLMPRAFLTVPYLGKGSCDPTLESQLLQGESVSDRKSVTNLSEITYMDINHYPMHDDIRNKVNNPSYLVEESAMIGWIRGGASTRDYYSLA
jgi:hypothetical protein